MDRKKFVSLIDQLREELHERSQCEFHPLFRLEDVTTLHRLRERLKGMPPRVPEFAVIRLVDTEFVKFLSTAGTAPRHEIREDIASLQKVKKIIQEINSMAVAGAFRDPEYKIAIRTSSIVDWLDRDIEALEIIRTNKIA